MTYMLVLLKEVHQLTNMDSSKIGRGPGRSKVEEKDDDSMDFDEIFGDSDLMKEIAEINFHRVWPVDDEGDIMYDVEPIPEDGDVCASCGAIAAIFIDLSNGITCCSQCNTVLEENAIDDSPEWRQHGNDDNAATEESSRCIGPSNFYFPMSSLGTTIQNNPTMNRFNNWNQMPYKERSLLLAFTIIQHTCTKAGIMKCIIDDAKDFYNTASNCKHKAGAKKGKQRILRGVNRLSMIAACVYYASCIRKSPLSYKYIAEIFKINYDEMTTGCRIFLDLMDQSGRLRDLDTNLPAEYIRLHKDLKLRKPVIEFSILIAENVGRLNIATEHMPPSIAAACIIMACEIRGVDFNKKDVAGAFDISDVTITKTYNKISSFRKALVSIEYTMEALKILTDEREIRLEKYKKGPLVPLKEFIPYEPESSSTGSSSESSDSDSDSDSSSSSGSE
jgi:transcription initiation factor TFIIIB Brf1 subunit/transcription initiation factor TFIIB